MFTKIRRRVTFANVAMTLALMFAMTGGAFAAKHYLITSAKQISPKVLAQLKGAKGPTGEKGATGAQGPQGDPGINGKDGAPGTNGSNGTNGKSVVTASFAGNKEPAAKPCAGNGGDELEVEGSAKKVFACNGSPWAAGGKLPLGATETGSWGFDVFTAGEVTVPISFALPVTHIGSISKVREPGLEVGHAIYIKKEAPLTEHATECPPGKATTWQERADKPAAANGYLCVFARGEASDITFGGFFDEEVEGGPVLSLNATLKMTEGSGALGSYTEGSFAVTGE